MTKRGTEAGPSCPIHNLLEVLTRPWTLHILWTLSNRGPLRFGVLRQSVDGISARVLTERLRALEQQGFIYRHYQPSIPPAVTYGITKRMKDIEKVLGELERVARKWGEEATGAGSAAAKREAVSAVTRTNTP